MPSLSDRVVSFSQHEGAAALASCTKAVSQLLTFILHTVRAHAGQELLILELAVVARWLWRQHTFLLVLCAGGAFWLSRLPRPLEDEATVLHVDAEEAKAIFRAMFAAAASVDVSAVSADDASAGQFEVVCSADEDTVAEETVETVELVNLDSAPFSSVAFAAGEWVASGVSSPVLSPRLSPTHAPRSSLVSAPLDGPLTLSLDSAVSSYNDQYSARVESVVLSADGGLDLCVLATGDGSLGPLQNAELSSLTVCSPDGEIVAILAPESWSDCEGSDRIHCVLHYRAALTRGASLSWSFGSSGYSSAELLTLDEALLSANPALSWLA